MNVQETRSKHETFIYREFDIQANKDQLDITFRFQIAPNIEFTPQISIPVSEPVNIRSVENLVFNIGLVEAISYWKSTCSPNFVIEAGEITHEQIAWWHDLFVHGLGEFYYKNEIDFTDPEFLTITSTGNNPKSSPLKAQGVEGDLVLIGGGKDSITTLEILKKQNKRLGVFLLNPTPAAINTTQMASITDPIIVTRTIDDRLLELNKKGYLNGHTPFSAYLSFLSTFVATLYKYEHVIASNERSAGEGNIVFHDLEINHQYSKGYRYEKLFTQYSKEFLTTDVAYFSFLRPLYELQIAALFTRETKYDNIFSSCNITRNEYWCGECPKCAFVYLVLNPFMEKERINKIFGNEDLFENPKIQQHILDLVGLGEHKPFDCVGTESESRMALTLTLFRYKRLGLVPSSFLVSIDKQLGLTTKTQKAELLNHIKNDWSEEHFLPPEYKELLLSELKSLNL